MSFKDFRFTSTALVQQKLETMNRAFSELKTQIEQGSGKTRIDPSLKRMSKLIGVADGYSIMQGLGFFEIESNREMLLDTLRKQHIHASKDDLLKEICSLLITSINFGLIVKSQNKSERALLKAFQDFSSAAAKGETARKSGKQSKRQVDDDRKKECLEATLKALGRDPIPEDFSNFVRNLKVKYPKPEYVPKPRLTPDEKTLPKEEIEILVAMKSDPNWKEQTLRKYWEDQTGLKARTKKLSSAK